MLIASCYFNINKTHHYGKQGTQGYVISCLQYCYVKIVWKSIFILPLLFVFVQRWSAVSSLSCVDQCDLLWPPSFHILSLQKSTPGVSGHDVNTRWLGFIGLQEWHAALCRLSIKKIFCDDILFIETFPETKSMLHVIFFVLHVDFLTDLQNYTSHLQIEHGEKISIELLSLRLFLISLVN